MVQPEEAGRLAAWLATLPPALRVLAILGIALAAHMLVRIIRRIGEWVATPQASPAVARDLLARRKPKMATLAGLVVSALTFTIYFIAFGFTLRELTDITLGQYFASATVIGLAVAFGTQGLVQDVVTGITLIFSDALELGDMIEVSGQTGRVEKIGLRFTTLTNFVGQTVLIPNRNIGLIGRFRHGYARAYVDVQLPDGVEESAVIEALGRVARGFRAQHPAVVVGDPRLHAVQQAGDDGWRFVRTRFRFWPGQQPLIESALRQRTIAAMRALDPSFADWMVTVTYRIQ